MWLSPSYGSKKSLTGRGNSNVPTALPQAGRRLDGSTAPF
ncbi:hypothetical protein KPSA1_02472 [Pseudomonas syringae pv. actinidiae]|uniref:Uncharacterized protein n=1 Tax=Pseudomonas syringae pv. actinidiae TaxID=103796 RepID=A0A2V0QEX5_PSESF|nr:hypothetical protein KPSA1_02472 [Pseudomonas syringae pv. actinidiae]